MRLKEYLKELENWSAGVMGLYVKKPDNAAC
jgi:hypothetical protein